ncbi:uncharacterized protein J8A68_005501 [[Candida] subhashii]|uniref:Uncharacterized protein n=1 Tax=[Candida] subhashii TaxID=561895 RepID=A0A8J5Q662_9ASCO|nr:uncharacterized protein J8A68_005501 [[Candida] subhashii]KAG7660981.1 hypothetical protein J8A68_005501 [[Candida] subhashii]
MIDFLKQSYNDPMQENIPKNVHDLFVDIAINEDLEKPVSTHVTDVTTTTPAADTTTTTGPSAPCASAATFTLTNIHPAAAAVTTNNHSILFTINEEDEDKVEIKYLATESIHHPLDLKFSGTIPKRLARG